jgi:hypothetical protein
MKYTTSISEWLGLITIKGIFDSGRQPSPENLPPIPAYGNKLQQSTHYHLHRHSLAEETLFIEIS